MRSHFFLQLNSDLDNDTTTKQSGNNHYENDTFTLQYRNQTASANDCNHSINRPLHVHIKAFNSGREINLEDNVT